MEDRIQFLKDISHNFYVEKSDLSIHLTAFLWGEKKQKVKILI